ncbi:MAG TPA: hypothetical protein VEP30_12310 [Chthoniobacterales bacterium]|nr:hypothetical protein [Chthoniobacterales bacterium]
MRHAVLSAAVVLLIGCASDRYEWSMSHLDLSPRAQKLPRPEVEQIVKLVVDASSSTVIAVGQSCDGKSDVFHVVVDYRPDRYMVYDVKKIGGRWKITRHEDASPTLTGLFDLC